MKTIVIAGRLTRDAELRRTQAGDAVLGFSVAVDDGYGQKKGTLYFDCSLFGKRGQSLEQHLKKGTSVTVSGDFGRRDHEGKTYLQVRVNDLTLQGGKNQSGERQSSGYGEEQSGYVPEDDDGDLPF